MTEPDDPDAPSSRRGHRTTAISRTAKHGLSAYIPVTVSRAMDLQPGQRITWSISADGLTASFTVMRGADDVG